MKKYNDKGFNIIACPCVSPWGYECIQRWSAKAVDPNRSFMSDVSECPAEESAAVVALVAKLKAEGKVDQWTMHIDMHDIWSMTFGNSIKMILKKSAPISFSSNNFRSYITNDLSKEYLEQNNHMLNVNYQL